MQPSTTVLSRGKPQFDMSGTFLGYPLRVLPESISSGLSARLTRYAIRRLTEAGFDPLLKLATIEVYTTNGDELPANRAYCVKFTTPQGGYIELIGILTKSGWPSLDHGFAIGTD